MSLENRSRVQRDTHSACQGCRFSCGVVLAAGRTLPSGLVVEARIPFEAALERVASWTLRGAHPTLEVGFAERPAPLRPAFLAPIANETVFGQFLLDPWVAQQGKAGSRGNRQTAKFFLARPSFPADTQKRSRKDASPKQQGIADA